MGKGKHRSKSGENSVEKHTDHTANRISKGKKGANSGAESNEDDDTTTTTNSSFSNVNKKNEENLSDNVDAKLEATTETTSAANKEHEEVRKEFKLRVVPLEKLLATPVEQNSIKKSTTSTSFKVTENQTTTKKRALRERNNTSIIELSDSSEDEEEDDYAKKEQPAKRVKHNSDITKNNKQIQSSGKDQVASQNGSKQKEQQLQRQRKNSSSDRSEIEAQEKESARKTTENDSDKVNKSVKSSSSSDSVEEDTLVAVQKKSTKAKSTSSTSSTEKEETSANSNKSEKSKPAADVEKTKEKRKNSESVSAKSSKADSNRRRRSSSSHTTNTNRRSTSSSSSSSSSSDFEQSVVHKNPAKSTKKVNGNSTDKSESTFKVRRCCVRIKRVQLSNSVTATNRKQKSNKKNMDMAEATTSSKSRRNIKSRLNDDDSDYDYAQSQDDDKQNTDNSDKDSNDSSDSEVMPQPKKRGVSKRDQASDSSSDFEPEQKKKKKRKRVKKNSSDSDENGDDDDDEKNKNKRKEIRKIIKTKDLDVTTKTAAKQEEERRKRIEERQKVYNQIFEKPENVEITELVLDFDDETKEPLLQVDKKLLKKLKPHQVAGVKFMWDACFETINDAKETDGSGCILAHCMGLGKTLQVVTLSHTLLTNSKRTHVERVLIISPLSTLNNWAREFVHWMGFASRKNIEVYDISRYKDKPTRIFKLYEWYQEGGVCILGYDMYRILANEKAKGLRKKQREQLQEALVDPGPDLVVCDEGHLLKNEKTSISKAVTKMRTKRRVVLTGTPLQNNLKEYYCMIQFIKPNLLGTYKEYMNRFVNPICNGQYTDSTDRDLRLMKHRSHILHKLLEACIQRRDYSVLAPYLPPKHEYVVYTTLSELQQELYEFYMTTQRDYISSDLSGKGARLFQDFQDLRRIWTHPMNLRVNSDTVIARRLANNDDSDIEGFICDDTDSEADGGSTKSNSDSDESFKSDASGVIADNGNAGGAGGSRVKKRKTRNGGSLESGGESMGGISAAGSSQKEDHDPSEWWRRFVKDSELNNIHHSPKLLILMRLLQQCETIGDKLLVFSQSLQSLDVIEHFLSLINSSTCNYEYEGDVSDFKGIWKPGEDYFRLDGSCSVEQREAMCKKFNNVTNVRARLFLISTRAGGLGINLVAANRVVIFDVSWNPSHDTQSIFRVYRFGQNKPCYIYRLIAMGTMEQKVYERQVAKQATAKRVIDEQQIGRHYNQSDLMELYTYELTPSTERELPILPKDRLFAELLTEHEKLIFKYHEHDSLLEQEEHESLNETERKAAWEEYEAEKTRTVQTTQYMSYDRNAFGGILGAQFGNASGSVTSNKIFGFRSDVLLQLLNMKIAKDYPDMPQNSVLQLVPTYLQTLYNQMNNGDPNMYKALLELHATIVHPSGMYMNPLLYANQNPSAAGYNQASTAGSGGAPGGLTAATAAPVVKAQGFNANEVYEID